MNLFETFTTGEVRRQFEESAMIVEDHRIEDEYRLARERFANHGVDVQEAVKTLDAIPISIQCWQGDDVLGFESGKGDLTGGIQAT